MKSKIEIVCLYQKNFPSFYILDWYCFQKIFVSKKSLFFNGCLNKTWWWWCYCCFIISLWINLLNQKKRLFTLGFLFSFKDLTLGWFGEIILFCCSFWNCLTTCYRCRLVSFCTPKIVCTSSTKKLMVLDFNSQYQHVFFVNLCNSISPSLVIQTSQLDFCSQKQKSDNICSLLLMGAHTNLQFL